MDTFIQNLRTSPTKGLFGSEIDKRKKIFGVNKIEPPAPTPFWKLMLEALSDKTMIILIIAAVVSLILTVTVIPASELEWMDSVAILVAVVVVVLVASTNDYSKEK